jgi:CheY-like chemotaxis protein
MTILYVDDDADDREIFCDVVKDINPSISVITARDGREAITMLNQSQPKLPDIIVLDMNMPMLTGFETLVELRRHEKLAAIKVVIYSTGVRPEILKQCDDLKIMCVNKGSTFKEAKTAIQHIIEAQKGSS